jgi:hypothetical protein
MSVEQKEFFDAGRRAERDRILELLEDAESLEEAIALFRADN